MFKLIILLLGLGIGFGGGVYWGVHHPDQAQQLSATEEQKFLEYEAQITKATKDKLDQLAAKQRTGSALPGSSFLGGAPAGGVDPDIKALQDQTQKQLDDLNAHLSKLTH